MLLYNTKFYTYTSLISGTSISKHFITLLEIQDTDFSPTYLPNNMTIQSNMAIKAPVLRPAEDRKAWAWQTLLLLRSLAFLWHTHTLRESVAVLLRGGSPPSATTNTRLKNSGSLSWLKPSRRWDIILAVLSGGQWGQGGGGRGRMVWEGGRWEGGWYEKGEGDSKTAH